jgi:enoyl-CoA hydratase/carnithine racemase
VNVPGWSEAEVVVRKEGGVGRLTLNRPKALNALTTNMCALITEALLEWRDDDEVELVLIDHAGERGFCAGGDIRLIQESGQGDGKAARAFFATEYRMNELLFRYAKPTVVVMDGITMGGGVGVSAPCRHRIATERTLWAMPEGDIGLYPDVGAGWYLPRLPGKAGAWLALTGARLRGADCVRLGIATGFVSSDRVEDFKAELTSAHSSSAHPRESGDPGVFRGSPPFTEAGQKCLGPRFRADERIERAIAEHGSEPGEAAVDAQHGEIDRLFAADTVEAIEQALAADGSDWAQAQLKTMARKCPTTQKVSMRLIEAGARRASFADEMVVEYRISARMAHRHDFIEGVRALIVDKDNSPRWDPDSLSGVTEEMLDAIFAELPSDEEWTPLAD